MTLAQVLIMQDVIVTNGPSGKGPERLYAGQIIWINIDAGDDIAAVNYGVILATQ